MNAGNRFGGLFRFLGSQVRRTVPPTKTAGTSGTLILAGFVVQNEKNQKLNADRYVTWSDMLANNDVISASVRYYLNLGSKATWTVVPADETPAAEEVAEFVDDVINDMRTPFYHVVRRALMQKWWGFSVQEWTAKKREDGKIGFLDIEPRPQNTITRWDTDENGHVIGMLQRPADFSSEIYLPRSKVVYIVDDSISDSPEGFGLFRHMTATSQLLKRYEELEKIGFENDLRGIPKARIPYSLLRDLVEQKKMTQSQADQITAPLEKFMQSHLKSAEAGVAIDSAVYRDTGESASPSGPPLFDFELVTGGATSQESVARAIERLQRQLARIAGTEGLLLGGDKVGSQALSEDKSLNFAVMMDSSLTELAEVFDSDIIGTLMLLNGIADDLWPSMQPEQVQYRSIEQLVNAIEGLARAGAVLAVDDPVIDQIRELAGLVPQPEIDLEDLNLRRDPNIDPEADPDLPENDPQPEDDPNVPDPADDED